MLKKSMLPPTLSCDGALELHAALVEEAGELAVDDRRADLGLDVVADDRQAGLLEALVPVVLAGDEHRQAVDEADAGLQRLLDVPLGRLLGADRQVADEDVGLRLLEDADDVGGLAGRLGDLLLQVLAEPVVGHAAMDLDAELGHVGELDRVVLAATRSPRRGPCRPSRSRCRTRRRTRCRARGSRRGRRASGPGPARRGRRPCSTRRPGRRSWRSCRRRRSRRGPCRRRCGPECGAAVGLSLVRAHRYSKASCWGGDRLPDWWKRACGPWKDGFHGRDRRLGEMTPGAALRYTGEGGPKSWFRPSRAASARRAHARRAARS